jgi:hypothetical protein
MKKLTTDVVAEIVSRLAAPEVKELIEATKAADASGTFEVVITTENLDRYQEVIKLDGWELEHYRNNPVVLWGHDHNRIIGVATSIDIVDGKMVAKGKFAPSEEAQEKRRLYDLGFLRATSVGFIEKEREGNLITKAELLEFSFVSVPANPYALSLAMKSGVSVNEMVTKGILTIEEKEEEPETQETEPITEDQPTGEPEPAAPADPAPEEKHFNTKGVQPVIEQAKALVTALEALVGDQEPERSEEPQADEEEKHFRDFSEKRRVLQNAATILGDVLAEARQVREVNK